MNLWHYTILTHLQAFVRMSINDLVPTSDGTTPQLLVLDTTYDPPLPVPLKVGDLNLDGFADIIPIIATPSGDRSRPAKTPKILGSVACSKGVAGCGPDGKGRRGWSVLGRDNNVLDEFQDARGVVLVDIDEDVSFASLCCLALTSKRLLQGTLDIMVQRTGEQGQGNVLFVQNNFYYDAFFLKAIGKSSMSRLFPFANVSYQFSMVVVQVGGVTLRMAAVSMYVLRQVFVLFLHSPQPFGVSYSGATYKYTVLDTTGQRAAAAGI